MALSDFLLICLAGGLGSMARVALSGAIARAAHPTSGILFINLFGSFLIGMALAGALFHGPAIWEPRSFAILSVGFLGGFTTVSTFALQVLELAQAGRGRRALALALVSALGCPIAALAGLGLGASL